jgi:vacuolar-type H+-ATPase subunit D/Vma8
MTRTISMPSPISPRSPALNRLAREYRRTERHAKALERVLLPEVKVALKYIDEQLDMMEREETIRTRWSHKVTADEEH